MRVMSWRRGVLRIGLSERRRGTRENNLAGSYVRLLIVTLRPGTELKIM
jgi:hypothetical protein